MTASDEARKALEGVSLGPWSVDGEVWNQIVWSGADNRVCFMAHSNGLDDDRDVATARFIAWAREGVPALRAENEALRAEVERLREAMAPFDRMAGAMFARNWNKDGVAISFVEKDGPIRLTFADFLAVRAALKGGTP